MADTPHRLIWSSGLVSIGSFRCTVDHPHFRDSGPARNWCFVFPRTAVEIQHEHERAFTANPNVVTFYNRRQAYRRNPISDDGDRCDWFGVDPDVARDVVRTFDAKVDDRPESPFRLTRAASDTATYLRQRAIFRAVTAGGWNDELGIEESVIGLLERVVRFAYRRAPSRVGVASRQREIADVVEWLLSRHWSEPLRLQDLASSAGVSVYHLCRTFRSATGVSIQQYRNRLRVRASLEPVWESARPLADIALDSGFYSHSHFTGAFRREFARTPMTLRRGE